MKFKAQYPKVLAACVVLVPAILLGAARYLAQPHFAAQAVDFNRDIRPILNQTCVSCHGGVRQRSGVSFIYRAEALGKGASGRATIVPGHPESSELISRVTSADPELRMPYHAPPLAPQQIDLLRQWITAGAHWEDHWAFVAPKPQTLPRVKLASWPHQLLDRFILSRLEHENLQPSPEASREALLRRVSLDLTGLPPTAEERAAFLADTSMDAYAHQVDRLLASPRFGERWASMWLDLARYADSRGYEKDDDRPTWPYRDWIIDAFNRNIPFDQFVVTQLAGDLLPHATFADQIATSFQRLTPANDEGGTDDEEFRMVAVMDRVATTWSVLNGLTMNCVQCHAHPYDPIRHTDYYKFLGFYNTSRDADLLDDSPTLPVPQDASRRPEVAKLTARRAELLGDIMVAARALNGQTRWGRLPIASGVVDEPLAVAHLLRQIEQGRSLGRNPDPATIPPAKLKAFYQRTIAQVSEDLRRTQRNSPPVALTIEHGEALAIGTIPVRVAYELLSAPTSGSVAALRIVAPVKNPALALHTPEPAFNVERIDVWVQAANGREQQVRFRWLLPDSEDNLANAAMPADIYSENSDNPLGGVSGFAANSSMFRTRWIVAVPDQPLTLAAGSRLRIQLLHTHDIDSRPAVVRRVRLETASAVSWPAPATDQSLKAKYAELAAVERRLAGIPTVPLPVMSEESGDQRRQTLEFERGNFLNKIGPPLLPDVPESLPRLPANAQRNRLAMAQWFFAPGQPLTSRVTVNRFWEQLFGTGIVETLEDFGSAGQAPSHPELLDWLALHFQNDLHWDMKALLRELVTSATYRQSAGVTPELLARDPRNRLLAHGPQQRLSAEMVRDQALLAGGLLSPAMGGPPVKPPQPAGVWMNVYSEAKWIDATGPDRYRRAVYTYLKRSALYPSYATFDASDHVVSQPRRIPTNTPLQALVTLNDPVYQEANQALGRAMIGAVAKQSLDARLDFAAHRVLSRDVTPGERAALTMFYRTVRTAPQGPVLNEQDALSAVAGVLFNLDAALTR